MHEGKVAQTASPGGAGKIYISKFKKKRGKQISWT